MARARAYRQEHIETMSDADIAASIGCPKTDAHSQQMCKRGDCKEKQTSDAKQPHFPEHANRRVAQMCDVYTGESMSEEARMVGASVPSVSACVKQGAVARERIRAMNAGLTSGRATTIAAPTIALNKAAQRAWRCL